MARDGCNSYFSFWAIFTPITAQKIKMITKKKKKKTPEDIIILHMCTKNFDQMVTVPEIWSATDGQTDRRTDGRTDNEIMKDFSLR